MLESEAEAEADAEAAGHDEEEDEEQEEGAGAEEQEGEKDCGASIEMLDEVMQRLSVTFDSGIYCRDNQATSSKPPARVRLRKINTLRRDGTEHALQASCRQGHGRCSLMVGLDKCRDRLHCETILLEWLAQGSSVSEQEHFASSGQLRKELGYKVRK